MKLGGKISTISRCMIDIIRTDPLSLGRLGRGVNTEKLEKMRHF